MSLIRSIFKFIKGDVLLWDIPRSTEVDEKQAQKKEGLEKEISESSLKPDGAQNSN